MKMQFIFTLTAILLKFLFVTNAYCEITDLSSSDKSSVNLQNKDSKKEFLRFFDIDKISNLKKEFAPIDIDGAIINSPTSTKKIKFYLSDIITALTTSTNDFAIFKYGDLPAIKLKLPYLGIGCHGIVFEIINESQEHKQILKFNIRKGKRSLRSGIKETYNYYFWKNISNKYSFDVTCMHEMHSYGLYCIKEKNNGISLTEYLINNKIIFNDDKNHKKIKVKKITQEELEKTPIKEISTAILDLLKVIKNNRENCSSISPNNIFINFDPETDLIKKIELIDYGISTHKIYNYFFIKNFNQYIKMALKRVKIYMKNDYIFSNK